jgi:flagella basal body P-ring formation protein FlgA
LSLKFMIKKRHVIVSQIFCAFCSLVGATLVAYAATAPGRAAEIVLRGKAVVQGPYVRLADVAELRGWTVQERAQWEQLLLRPAPEPGERYYLRVRQIQELLLLQGMPLEGVELTGAAQVEVSAQDYPERSVLRAGTVDDARSSSGAPSRQEPAMLVAVRTLRAGERIHADDVVLKNVPTRPRHISRPIYDLRDAVGQELATTVPAGEVIDATMLRKPYLVQRGKLVTITSRVGGVAVRMMGRALEDGVLDDVVSVEWLDNRQKRLTARVVDLDAVEVVPQPEAVLRPGAAARTAPRPESAVPESVVPESALPASPPTGSSRTGSPAPGIPAPGTPAPGTPRIVTPARPTAAL